MCEQCWHFGVDSRASYQERFDFLSRDVLIYIHSYPFLRRLNELPLVGGSVYTP